MDDTYTDLLACEDLLMFAGAAISGTGQREFHAGAERQGLGLDFLHEYVHQTLPDLYAAMLALHVNDHNALRIVHTLLSRPGDGHPRQNALIRRRLARTPPQRVYRLFRRLAAEHVNNRRTRATMRDWLLQRPHPALDAIKYRKGLRDAARHARLRLPDEIDRFVFSSPADRRRARYEDPLLRAHGRAFHAARDLYALPFTVAEGFAARHGVPRERFLASIAERTTRDERLRLTESARRAGTTPLGAVGDAPLMRLCSYVVGLPVDQRRERRAELESALEASARRAAGDAAGSWPDTALVLDDSYSSFGSPVRRNRPLAVALACRSLVSVLSPGSTTFWLSGHTDHLTVRPTGPTLLAERILDALACSPARVVVVSDGHDSAPELLSDTLRVWRSRLDPGHTVSMVHLNPALDGEGTAPRRLSPAVPTLGLHDPATLPSLVELARFGQGRSGLADLRAHMDAAVATYLEER
ncbi:hypothetical protein [Nocardiopsis sp. MG754419]|uniref:hypothetical protein n=1 Tax=Nocardiopsis sp. MG754419 TaxID=2259865 RepID=UPI001BA669D1|nr:hypothetical protein [Nocardiopsis sp. MG754419]MBR8744759.1 hypothetical protein [Nocardiopsis sp. MG754419]